MHENEDKPIPIIEEPEYVLESDESDSDSYPEETKAAVKDNEPPSQAAVDRALAFREEPAEIVSQFNGQLAVLDAQVKELEKQKRSLEWKAGPHIRRVKACDTVLAPIRRVPFDVIREITRFVLPEHPTATKRNAPLSLCHTSSAWRRAVLSLPELWTTLYIVVGDLISIHRYKRRVLGWFQRAQGRPCSLYLHFRFSNTCFKVERRSYGSFLRNIRSSMGQVRHLGISSKCVGDALPCFENAAWALEGLETLELRSDEYSSEDWVVEEREPDPNIVIPPLYMFRTATKLRIVMVENDFMRRIGAHALLPWAQLTTVILTEWLRVDHWRELMESCTQMQLGQFRVAAESVPESTVPKFVVPQLEELRLCVMYTSESILRLLDVFDLPVLRVLDLHHGDVQFEDEPTSPPAAKEIKALETIETLYFYDAWYKSAPGYVLEMLTETVNLRELELTGVVAGAAYQNLFKAMSFAEPHHILPLLSRLYISAPDEVTDWAAFIEMVHSRCFEVPVARQTLTELSVVIYRYYYKPGRDKFPAIGQLKEALRSCEDAGLLLRVGDYFSGIPSLRPSTGRLLNGWYPRLSGRIVWD